MRFQNRLAALWENGRTAGMSLEVPYGEIPYCSCCSNEGQKSCVSKASFCNFPHSCTDSEEYTDDDGMAEFDDVPVGEYRFS